MELILVGPSVGLLLTPSHNNNNIIIITANSLLLFHQITTSTVAKKCTNDNYCRTQQKIAAIIKIFLHWEKKIPVTIITFLKKKMPVVVSIIILKMPVIINLMFFHSQWTQKLSETSLIIFCRLFVVCWWQKIIK